ncbi:MAG: YIP1 family protein [Candidatus Eremiobacteraeota bacterium]|nr:YIP1 family protein [Candidatus Eremiobacteraeota bacterium]
MAMRPTGTGSSGLRTMVDTIVAPAEAFESIRVVPTWGWALAITILLSVLGSFLLVPAIQHAIVAGWPDMVAQQPALARLSPEQQHTMLAFDTKMFGFAWIFPIVTIPIVCLLGAIVMLLFNAMGRGDGTFAKFFSASCNIAVPTAGLAAIVTALIVLVRGQASFNSLTAVSTALPSLAMLAPASNVKLIALLAAINPFSIWAVLLTVGAMSIIGHVPRLQAWLAAIVMFLIPALAAMAGAK